MRQPSCLTRSSGVSWHSISVVCWHSVGVVCWNKLHDLQGAATHNNKKYQRSKEKDLESIASHEAMSDVISYADSENSFPADSED